MHSFSINKGAAIERSNKALGTFLLFLLSSSKLQQRLFHSIELGTCHSTQLVKRIQRRWRKERELDAQRLATLKRMWNSTCEELKAQFTRRRDRRALKKLSGLKDKTRDGVVKSHYANVKRRYAVMLVKWIRSTYAPEKLNKMRLRKFKYSSVLLSVLYEKPLFAPFPGKKEMADMILTSAGIPLK